MNIIRPFFFICVAVLGQSALGTTLHLAQEVEEALEQIRQEEQTPGLTFSVFSEDRVLFSGALGVADLQTQAPLSPSTSLFRIASASKLFTTIAVAQLIERRILSLETPLLSLTQVPFVKKIRENESSERLQRWAKIRIRHLLAHHAGISKDTPGGLMFFNMEALDNNSYVDMKTFFNSLKDIEFLLEEPGEFRYSNFGMNLLARIVAGVNPDKLSFPAYVRKHILSPLGMRNTFYRIPENQKENMARGYGKKGSRPDGGRTVSPLALDPGSYDGSVGVASTSHDLARFGMELSRLVTFLPNRLLNDRELIRFLFTPASRRDSGKTTASGPMWLSFTSPQGEDTVWTGHSGTGFAERAFLFTSPELGYGISLQWNANDANRNKYAQAIMDILGKRFVRPMPPKAAVLVNDVKKFLQDTPPQPKLTPAQEPLGREKLQRFVGTYHVSAVGDFTLSISEDGYLHFDQFGGHKLKVEDLARGHFRFLGSAGVLFKHEPLRFTFDARGDVTGFHAAWSKYFRRVER